MNNQRINAILWLLLIVKSSTFGLDARKKRLFKFVASSNQEKLIKLIKRGVDLNKMNIEGNTVLLLATMKGDIPITNLLLNNGANPNLVDKNGRTALHNAALNSNNEIISLLLAKGANPNIADNSGSVPLCFAKTVEDTRLFLENRTDLKRICRNGIIINLFFSKERLLKEISEDTYYKILDLLLKNNANLNEVDENGMSSLHWSAFKNDTRFIEGLISNSTNQAFNLKDNRGNTPLLSAFSIGSIRSIKLLLDAGADPNVINKPFNERSFGDTPLGLGISLNLPIEVINSLLAKGANPNTLNGLFVQTPLSLACLNNTANTNNYIETLLSFGANPNIRDGLDGESPISWCIVRGNIMGLLKLVEKGADINIKTFNGNTPLITATFNNQIEIVTHLLKIGANKSIKNLANKTAKDIASEKGFVDILNLLEK